MSTPRMTELLESTMGTFGGIYIADTTAITGNFTAIQVLEDCTFTLMTGNITGLGAATLEAGTIVYGRFTAITLATGKVIAYKAR